MLMGGQTAANVSNKADEMCFPDKEALSALQ